jgi:hypothetical protein
MRRLFAIVLLLGCIAVVLVARERIFTALNSERGVLGSLNHSYTISGNKTGEAGSGGSGYRDGMAKAGPSSGPKQGNRPSGNNRPAAQDQPAPDGTPKREMTYADVKAAIEAETAELGLPSEPSHRETAYRLQLLEKGHTVLGIQKRDDGTYWISDRDLKAIQVRQAEVASAGGVDAFRRRKQKEVKESVARERIWQQRREELEKEFLKANDTAQYYSKDLVILSQNRVKGSLDLKETKELFKRWCCTVGEMKYSDDKGKLTERLEATNTGDVKTMIAGALVKLKSKGGTQFDRLIIVGHSGGGFENGVPPGVALQYTKGIFDEETRKFIGPPYFDKEARRWIGPVGSRFQLRELEKDPALVESIKKALDEKKGILQIAACGYILHFNEKEEFIKDGIERYPRDKWEAELQGIANILDRAVCAPRQDCVDDMTNGKSPQAYENEWACKVPESRWKK